MGASSIVKQARRSAGVSALRRSGKARRHFRLRKKVVGSAERPRLVVTRSTRHLFVQVVDDARGVTLASASTYKLTDGDKTAQARQLGATLAEAARAAGVTKVVFDRGGRHLHRPDRGVRRRGPRGRTGVLGHAHDREEHLMPGPQRGARTGGTGGPGGPGGNDRGGDRRDRRDGGRGAAGAERSTHLERVVTINRVAKVVKGGRRFSFTALVVVGDGDGTVGVGYGKAKEVPAAIAKGVEEAKKHFFKVPRIQATIPHPVTGEAAAGVVLLKPASPGTGVIAGGPVRAVLECAGIHDVLSKSLGSDNPINIVHATVDALRQLVRPEEVAARRGLPLEDVAPAGMLRARAGQGA